MISCDKAVTNTHETTVVGQEELESRSVNVRNRDDVGSKEKNEKEPLDEIAKKLVALKASRSLQNSLV